MDGLCIFSQTVCFVAFCNLSPPSLLVYSLDVLFALLVLQFLFLEVSDLLVELLSLLHKMADLSGQAFLVAIAPNFLLHLHFRVSLEQSKGINGRLRDARSQIFGCHVGCLHFLDLGIFEAVKSISHVCWSHIFVIDTIVPRHWSDLIFVDE